MKILKLVRFITEMTIVLVLCGGCVQAAVWQWSVPVKRALQPSGASHAYLWIPENCRHVRAFIFAQNNMEEQSILENISFRQSMANLGIAEVWVSPAYDLTFNFETGAGEVFNTIMNDLAEISGYRELAQSPFIAMGHSAAASAPYYMAAWNPGRALAAISVSGQWPYFRDRKFAPDIWNGRNIDFIPCLETMGEYEAASTWSAEGLQQRQTHPNLPLSMLACPGEGHFNATQQKIDFIAFYIKKAAHYRLPAKNRTRNSLPLLPVDPQNTGWLAPKWTVDLLPTASAAPVKNYSGNPSEAFWYFDRETVEAVHSYQNRFRSLATPLVGYLQHQGFVPQANTHQQVDLTFEPLKDGITFHIKCRFYDSVPGGSPRPGVWVKRAAGVHVSQPATAKVHIDRITGPVLKVDDTTFTVQPQLGFERSARSYEAWFVASFSGNKEFRSAFQQARMRLPPQNLNGEKQEIHFNPIADVQKSTRYVRPVATATSGLPVRFYIAEGPAEVIDGVIHLRPVPPSAKYPVKIAVIAWQYGRSASPGVQTADPIEHVFYIK